MPITTGVVALPKVELEIIFLIHGLQKLWAMKRCLKIVASLKVNVCKRCHK